MKEKIKFFFLTEQLWDLLENSHGPCAVLSIDGAIFDATTELPDITEQSATNNYQKSQ